MNKEANWLEYYKITFNMFRENAKFSWEMLKHYTILCSSIVTVCFAFFGALLGSDIFMTQDTVIKILLMLFSLVFPYLLYNITKRGSDNFTRECSRLYERLGILIKLDRKYGFTSDVRDENNKDVFPNDNLYIPEKWKENWSLESETDFVKKMMDENNDTYFSDSIKLFKLFNIITGIIVIFIGIIVSYLIYEYFIIIDP